MGSFTLTDLPGIESTCPAVPENASNWERQEADHFWREALYQRREAIERLITEYEAIVTIRDAAVGLTSGNLAQVVSKAEQASAQLNGVLNGIRHRLALSAKTDEITPERIDRLVQAIRRVDGNHDLGAAALAEALLSDGAV